LPDPLRFDPMMEHTFRDPPSSEHHAAELRLEIARRLVRAPKLPVELPLFKLSLTEVDAVGDEIELRFGRDSGRVATLHLSWQEAATSLGSRIRWDGPRGLTDERALRAMGDRLKAGITIDQWKDAKKIAEKLQDLPNGVPLEAFRQIVPGSRALEGLVRTGFNCSQDCGLCWQGRHWGRVQPEQILTWIEDLRAGGAQSLIISGGEPTLDNELPRYLERARELGFAPITLETNAIRMARPGFAQKLKDAGLERAFVSLHSGDPSVSDRITRAPGTHVKTVKGIQELLNAGVGVALNCVITADSIETLADLPDFVHNTFGKHEKLETLVISDIGATYDSEQLKVLIPRPEMTRKALTKAVERALILDVKTDGLGGPCGPPLCMFGADPRVIPIEPLPSPVDFRKYVPACNSCGVQFACYGVRDAHAERFGDDYVQPLPPPQVKRLFAQELKIEGAPPTLAVGRAARVEAIAMHTDGARLELTHVASWSSDNAAVATVKAGVITPLSIGSVRITAIHLGAAAEVEVNVVESAVTSIAIVSPATVLGVGAALDFHVRGMLASGAEFDGTPATQWSSSNSGITSVDSRGQVAAHALGNVTLTASAFGLSASVALEVRRASRARAEKATVLRLWPMIGQIAINQKFELKATAVYADGTALDVTIAAAIASSNNAVVKLFEGVVEGHSQGSVLLSASLNGTSYSQLVKSGHLSGGAPEGIKTLTIRSSVADPLVYAAEAMQLRAFATFSDGRQEEVTSSIPWGSSSPDTLTVFAGQVTGVADGTASVAVSAGGITARTTVRVETRTLTALRVQVHNPELKRGLVSQSKAIGVYSNGTEADITSWAKWESSDLNVLQVNPPGALSAVGVGEVEVRIVKDGIIGSAKIMVA
jgi:MoaA/NifB/PqqE/SkfB family radical SAM enzyme